MLVTKKVQQILLLAKATQYIFNLFFKLWHTEEDTNHSVISKLFIFCRKNPTIFVIGKAVPWQYWFATNLLEVFRLVLLLWANHNLIFLFFFFSFCSLIYFHRINLSIMLFYCIYCVGRIPQETMHFVISRLCVETQLIHPTTCTMSHRPSSVGPCNYTFPMLGSKILWVKYAI